MLQDDMTSVEAGYGDPVEEIGLNVANVLKGLEGRRRLNRS